MTILTPQQRQAIQEAGEHPVRITDPETDAVYVLVKAETYDRVKDLFEPNPSTWLEIPPGIVRSRSAYLRDLPELLKSRKLRGKWVAYHGDERIAIGRTQTEVIKVCLKYGLGRDEYDVDVIAPALPEPEEIDSPSWEVEEIDPVP